MWCGSFVAGGGWWGNGVLFWGVVFFFSFFFFFFFFFFFGGGGVTYNTKTLAKIDKMLQILLLLTCTYVGNEVLKVLSHFGVISRRFRRGLVFYF